MALGYYLACFLVEGDNLLGIGDLCEAKLLCYLWTYLCCVAVDGLASAEDDVVAANLLDGLGEGVGCGKGVSTAKWAVRYEDAFVGSSEDAFLEHFGCLGQTHGDHGDGGTWISVLEAECLFEGVQILRVEHGRKGCTVHGTLWSHCVRSDIACVGYLLCEYDDF